MPYIQTSYYDTEDYFSWDAWAYSAESLIADGFFEFSVELRAGIVCGISPLGISQYYTAIKHGFYFSNGMYWIIESGALKTQTGASFSNSNTFKIRRNSGTIEYIVNGNIVYESDQSFTGDAKLYAAMYGFGDAIVDAYMEDEDNDREYSVFSILPSFISMSMASDNDAAICACKLPLLESSSYAETTLSVYSELQHLESVALVEGIGAIHFGEIPGITSFALESELEASLVSCSSVIPALLSSVITGGPVIMDSSIPAIQSVGLVSDISCAVSFSDIPAMESNAFVVGNAYMYAEIPSFSFSQMYVLPIITGNVLAGFEGYLSGGQTGAEVLGPLFLIGGQLACGASIGGTLFGITGGMTAEEDAPASMTGSILGITGSLETGAGITGEVFSISGFASGDQDSAAGISGSIASLSGSIGVDIQNVCDIGGKLFYFGGTLSAVQDSIADIHGETFKLNGYIGGGQGELCDIYGTLLSISGSMSLSSSVEILELSIGISGSILASSSDYLGDKKPITLIYSR